MRCVHVVFIVNGMSIHRFYTTFQVEITEYGQT